MKHINNIIIFVKFQIFRHGDRTPVDTSHIYPNDPYKHSNQWPAPWGELTNVSFFSIYPFF